MPYAKTNSRAAVTIIPTNADRLSPGSSSDIEG
jgi:hypothetical protein